jgi:hypothetical protein
MVKVWFVRDGPRPTIGGPAYELSLSSSIELLELKERHWLTDRREDVRFGNQDSALTEIAGNKHVVCEIDEGKAGWRAGFYRIDLTPEETVRRVGRPPREPWEDM